jgi:osmoprotectant transport system permease protein
VTVVAAAIAYLIEHPALFRGALATHLALSGAALALAIALAVPVAIAVARHPVAAFAATNTANVLRTVPSLAVMALALPLLGIGFVPSLVALTILGLPPILTNTYVALREVDADAVESASGMGMTRGQILRRIEIPLAMPVIVAGVRTAAVQIVASATLAAFIGGGGLGDFITMGIGMMQVEVMLVGAVPVSVLAVATEVGFARLELRLTPRGIRDTA